MNKDENGKFCKVYRTNNKCVEKFSWETEMWRPLGRSKHNKSRGMSALYCVLKIGGELDLCGSG
jgi:hypothetical protein